MAKEEGIAKLGAVTQGELPKDATVKELNVCPRVDYAKATALGLPDKISINEMIRDYIHTHMSRERPAADEPAAKRVK